MRLHVILLLTIVLFAFLLRVVVLDRFPVGFTADEAAQGYTAYSILQTGKDEWGISFPLNPRSFGDFKPPVYTYLTVLSVAAFGLTEFSVRFPSALFGTLAVFFTYLLSKKLTNDSRIGLLAALLLAISPWHMPLSRGAFEANLSTSILTAAIYFFLRGFDSSKWFIPASVLFGLNMFTYHSAKFLTPLLVLVLLNWKKDQLLSRRKSLVLPVFILGGLGLMVAASFLSGAGSRAADLAIFRPTDGWAAIADRRFEAVLAGIPDAIARIFSNKITYVISIFSKSFLQYFSIEFLFGDGAGEGTYGMIPGRGILYFYEIITLGFALYLWITKKVSYMTVLVLWIVMAAVPAAMAKGFHAANRFAASMPAWQILSAIGAISLYDLVKTRWPRSTFVIRALSFVIILFFFAFFLESYFIHAPVSQAGAMRYGWSEAVNYIREHQHEYNKIYVSRKLSEPQTFLAFYLPIEPEEFQLSAPSLMQYEKDGKTFLDQLGSYSIGKYIFEEIPRGIVPKEGSLYVGTLDELHELRKTAIHQIDYPNHRPAFIFVTKLPDPEIPTF